MVIKCLTGEFFGVISYEYIFNQTNRFIIINIKLNYQVWLVARMSACVLKNALICETPKY